MKTYILPIFYAVLIAISLIGHVYAQKAWVGRTTGGLPYIEYSGGMVRLGADKMGFIDTDVRVVVLDSVENRYKIRLSKNWEAYIPKHFVIRGGQLSDSVTSADVLSGTWHLSAKDNYDVLTISLPDRLPYRSYQVVEPNKIIVDVFGATSNTTWITQLKKARIVKSVYREQLEKDVYRIHIDLEGKQNWGYSINYDNTSLRISVKHAPAKKGIKNLFIAIDPGHGGNAKGAVSPNGTEEKIYNLKFAKELQTLLHKKGVKNVYLTRTEDIDIATTDRVLKLREVKPDLLISLHLNASSRTEVKGVSTYYHHNGSRGVSKYILDEMLDLGLNEFGLIGNFNFLLNSPTEYPNSLVEIAFLSNPEDEQRILNEKFHKQTADKIYKGIVKWLKEVQ
ncbi:N-acetylmuramoyl-L-alanine amidase [Sphingobacterium faecale]|uniref:N-acetylmuramoyl-L-alanine amidase n=1 Tax=Sphingobacterium faecale TaxID=2803775 RepID=A0ABS1R2F5_9SPHI|nr:N-acetylmuramoyl-L-alanine amidase [Sphingobacterium faecale]MBL1408886.1 N-acetylmuramoyl-L-alanine amidase [Sphingobacterium faecale]